MIELYQPLVIEPKRFIEAYNLDIEPFVERNTFKESAQNKGRSGGKEIKYMSYSHAIRLLREYYPELVVDCMTNPHTGSYIFTEFDGKSCFLKAFVHDGERRSPAIYYAVLEAPTINNLNKNYYRAITKAIAVVTGIGLKLWTGDDLGEDIQNPKAERLAKIAQLAEQYEELTGKAFDISALSMSSDSTQINAVGKNLSKLIKNHTEKSQETLNTEETN